MASLVLACGGLAAGVSGCSSDDNKNDGGPEGGADTNMPMDTGVGMDSGNMDSGDASGPAMAKLILVHASQQLWGIRVCFAANGNLTPLPALPHDPATQPASLGFPGIPPGAGGPFPSTGTDITPLTITPYVMNADSIKTHVKGEMGGEKKCSDLLNPDGGTLVANQDYWKLPDIPANTLQHGNTYILMLEGCDKNANFGSVPITTALCGASWSNTTGNLAVKIYQVDNKVADMSKMGAQYVHAAPPLQAVYQGGAIGLTAQTDAGNIQIINAMPANNEGAIQPATASKLGAPGATDVLANTLILADGGVGAIIPIPLGAVETLTTGMAPTGMYKANGNFTFIMLGNPSRTADGGLFYPDAGQPISVNQGYALHALGFSNDPVIPPLQ
jgi:hypothetical protein